MRRNRFTILVSVALIATVMLACPDRARACAVCFGDADSPMTKGAASGILVLAAIVYTLLLGFGSTMLYWMVRSRRQRYALGSQSTPVNDHDSDDLDRQN